MKEFAFARSAVSAGGGSAVERQPPRFGASSTARPALAGAEPRANLSGGTDEIGDVPAFLRRGERLVEG